MSDLNNFCDFTQEITLQDIIREQYEVIENHSLEATSIEERSVAGALFTDSDFNHVHFENVTFFASRIARCTFTGCEFINCNFQFSHIDNCNFIASSFQDCHWQISTLNSSLFQSTELDTQTSAQAARANNAIEECHNCYAEEEYFLVA